jgi:hypothetical protein
VAEPSDQLAQLELVVPNGAVGARYAPTFAELSKAESR